jgi:hypothetical protein
VCIRSRKPWVFARRRLFGWKVRLLTGISPLSGTAGTTRLCWFAAGSLVCCLGRCAAWSVLLDCCAAGLLCCRLIAGLHERRRDGKPGSMKRPGYAGLTPGYGQPAGRVKLTKGHAQPSFDGACARLDQRPPSPIRQDTPNEILAPALVLWEEQESC